MTEYQPMQVSNQVITVLTDIVKTELLKNPDKNYLLDGLKCYDYPLYTSLRNVETKLKEYNGTQDMQEFITELVYTVQSINVNHIIELINKPLSEDFVKLYMVNGSLFFLTTGDLDFFKTKFGDNPPDDQELLRAYWFSKNIILIENLEMAQPLKLKLQSFLHDLKYCMDNSLQRASLLLMRGVFIGVLANFANLHPEKFEAPNLKGLSFEQWPLTALIKQAVESGVLKVVDDSLMKLIRIMNNYDNPYAEKRNPAGEDCATSIFGLLDSVVKQLESGQLSLKI